VDVAGVAGAVGESELAAVAVELEPCASELLPVRPAVAVGLDAGVTSGVVFAGAGCAGLALGSESVPTDAEPWAHAVTFGWCRRH
jgi:hypothetical protein